MKEIQSLEIVEKPTELMRHSTDIASVCREIVLKTAVTIQGRKYVKVEGWQSIATAHGCIASSKDVKKIDSGWTAIGEIRRISDGVILSTAEGFVGTGEKRWGAADEYACRAMAQTRAISRACRAAFAHVVVLMDAGLSTTPAEEVPDGGFDAKPPQRPQTTIPERRTEAKATSPVPATPKIATAVTRTAMIEFLLANGVTEQDILGYAIDKSVLLPSTEGLQDWPLDKVPTTRTGWKELVVEVMRWRDGDLASPVQVPRDPPTRATDDDPPCFDIVVPIPHKGEKRNDYMKNPDTIGSLYHAMKAGDEAAQSRLWGFVSHYEPKGWTKSNGTAMPASDSDVNFRASLDEFNDWHDKNKSDDEDVTP